MFCYALSLIDRQILSLLVAPTKRDLGICDTQSGLQQGLSFAAFYTLAGRPLRFMRTTSHWLGNMSATFGKGSRCPGPIIARRGKLLTGFLLGSTLGW